MKINRKNKLLCLCIFALTVISGCGQKGLTETQNMDTPETVGTIETNETVEATTTQEEHSVSDTDSGTLTYIGHASVKIKTKAGKVIYIDPEYSVYDYSEPADFILVTHGHDDHKPCNKVIPADECITITHKEALIDGVYQTFDYDGIKIESVAAANSNHDIKFCVGYVVTVDGVSIYHAGDTSMIEQMKDLTARNLDYAMYPIDGLYNMDAKEATDVANLVAAKHNLPIHEFNNSGQHKEDNFNPQGRLVLAYGESLSYVD